MTNFCTPSTAVTVSIFVLVACDSDVSDFTEASKSESVSMLDSFDKIAFCQDFYRYIVKVC